MIEHGIASAGSCQARFWAQNELHRPNVWAEGDSVCTVWQRRGDHLKTYQRTQEDGRMEQEHLFRQIPATFRWLLVFNRFERFIISSLRLCRRYLTRSIMHFLAYRVEFLFVSQKDTHHFRIKVLPIFSNNYSLGLLVGVSLLVYTL